MGPQNKNPQTQFQNRSTPHNLGTGQIVVGDFGYNPKSVLLRINRNFVAALLLVALLLTGSIIDFVVNHPKQLTNTNPKSSQNVATDINGATNSSPTKTNPSSSESSVNKTVPGAPNAQSDALKEIANTPNKPSGGTVAQAPPEGGCSSSLYRKADGSYWHCSFNDEFDGNALDRSKWRVSLSKLSGAYQGVTCGLDNGQNIKVAGGAISLLVKQEASSFLCESPLGNFQTSYTGASISTRGIFEQAYGRYEIRAKFPTATVNGVHSALWLYPSKMTYGAWPASGEIDIAEFYSKYADRAIPYIHYNVKSPSDALTNTQCKLQAPTQYHTYLLEWTPSSIVISYDGKVCVSHRIDPTGSLHAPAPFDQPFAVYLTQTLDTGQSQNAFTPGTVAFPQTMTIDWVRVWK